MEIVQILIEFLRLRDKSCRISVMVYVLSKICMMCIAVNRADEFQTGCFVLRFDGIKVDLLVKFAGQHEPTQDFLN